MLPKIHKVGNPGRPIVSTINRPTELISQYLDSIFSPIVKGLPTYVRDSSEMIRTLETITLPEHGEKFLFTLDVKSLYTIIPQSDGLNAIRFYLRSHQSANRPDEDTIVRLTDLVLTRSSFSFNGKYYKQKKGVKMGTKMGPSYACLFMGYIESRFLSNYEGLPKHLLLRRYIDDYLGIAVSSKDEVMEFIDRLGNMHPSVQLTNEVSDASVAFLDLKVTIEGTGITTSVHYKLTDSHTFLNYASSHPPACKNSIPFSQLSRIRRICSEEDDYNQRADEMQHFFKQRGYPDEILTKAAKRVDTSTRADFLHRRNEEEAS
ncbi:uncharacterized protein LOC121416797 [Lytechinus variegatus]|uniref:uncharacterized protein LOC121416797 n=1 Tax=Lytechinus variegatus TaxID=7654 RepID=UPI001BB1C576|nr:uncharacterized protein LOC121416797 [Lytechinus variegatus]